MIKNKLLKNILIAFLIAVAGLVLLNLTFAFYTLLVNLVGLFLPKDFMFNNPWFGSMQHVLFLIIIGIISWYVYKSGLKEIYKATYLVVPLAVIFATIGIALYRWPWAAYSVGILSGIGVLIDFLRTKKSWPYIYTLILIGLSMLIFSLIGGEI